MAARTSDEPLAAHTNARLNSTAPAAIRHACASVTVVPTSAYPGANETGVLEAQIFS